MKQLGVYKKISIHALHTKCDLITIYQIETTEGFQSTHFIRSATQGRGFQQAGNVISIHALHTKCDPAEGWVGGRAAMSSHALHTKCDFVIRNTTANDYHFNPRTSYEVRRNFHNQSICIRLFQSTHFIRSATWRNSGNRQYISYFNPRTSYEVRPSPFLDAASWH